MKLNRWTIRCLVLCPLIVLLVVSWWWATIPDRAMDSFVDALRGRRFDDAIRMAKYDRDYSVSDPLMQTDQYAIFEDTYFMRTSSESLGGDFVMENFVAEYYIVIVPNKDGYNRLDYTCRVVLDQIHIVNRGVTVN